MSHALNAGGVLPLNVLRRKHGKAYLRSFFSIPDCWNQRSDRTQSGTGILMSGGRRFTRMSMTSPRIRFCSAPLILFTAALPIQALTEYTGNSPARPAS